MQRGAGKSQRATKANCISGFLEIHFVYCKHLIGGFFEELLSID
jgi:hypothetical protein